MGAGFYYFRFQRPMASFQFRKMRCSGHIERSPSVRSWEVLRSSALAGQGKASAPEPAICHAIRERRVCLATAEAAGANLHEVLRFQHSPNRLEKDLAGEARTLCLDRGMRRAFSECSSSNFRLGAASVDGGYAALGGREAERATGWAWERSRKALGQSLPSVGIGLFR